MTEWSAPGVIVVAYNTPCIEDEGMHDSGIMHRPEIKCKVLMQGTGRQRGELYLQCGCPRLVHDSTS